LLLNAKQTCALLFIASLIESAVERGVPKLFKPWVPHVVLDSQVEKIFIKGCTQQKNNIRMFNLKAI
jgi:hypothetical protein